RRIVRARDGVGDPAGDRLPRLRRAAHLRDGAAAPSLRAARLGGVHGDRPLLADRRAHGGPRPRALLHALSRSGRSRLRPLGGAKVVVLGLAVTGRVAARVLADAGAHVVASDAADVDVVGLDGVDVETGGHDRARRALEDADFVVPSPGIPPGKGLLAEA